MGILGIKTGYDAVNLYNMEMKFNEKVELEKTRKLAREAEAIFTSMYQSMNDVRALAEEYLNLPVQDRKRDLVISCLAEITRKNTEIDGLGVAFEKDRFDGRDDIDGRFTPSCLTAKLSWLIPTRPERNGMIGRCKRKRCWYYRYMKMKGNCWPL